MNSTEHSAGAPGHPFASDIATVQARLRAAGVNAERLRVGPEAVVVVSPWGGRIYGPFFDSGPCENWLPEAFSSDDALTALVASRSWNLGGDRLWVGPEITYMIPDRSDYWGSCTMPPSMDPGTHHLTRSGDEITLHREVNLQAFIKPSGSVSVQLQLRVRPVAHPLRHLRGEDAALSLGYAGYVTEVRTTVRSDGAQPVESWVLAQVQAGGTALVAASPQAQVTDYYEPVDELLRQVPGGLTVSLTGADRFKVGFAAPNVTGRVGYLRRTPLRDHGVLLVRASHSEPSAEYAEEPDPTPGVRGDPLHLYNDDGALGGFAEVEARGTPLLGPGPDPVVDRFATWWFCGPVEELAVVAQHLLGIPADVVAASV